MNQHGRKELCIMFETWFILVPVGFKKFLLMRTQNFFAFGLSVRTIFAYKLHQNRFISLFADWLKMEEGFVTAAFAEQLMRITLSNNSNNLVMYPTLQASTAEEVLARRSGDDPSLNLISRYSRYTTLSHVPFLLPLFNDSWDGIFPVPFTSKIFCGFLIIF